MKPNTGLSDCLKCTIQLDSAFSLLLDLVGSQYSFLFTFFQLPEKVRPLHHREMPGCIFPFIGFHFGAWPYSRYLLKRAMRVNVLDSTFVGTSFVHLQV